MTYATDLRLTDNGELVVVSITTLTGSGDLARRAEATLERLDEGAIQ